MSAVHQRGYLLDRWRAVTRAVDEYLSASRLSGDARDDISRLAERRLIKAAEGMAERLAKWLEEKELGQLPLPSPEANGRCSN